MYGREGGDHTEEAQLLLGPGQTGTYSRTGRGGDQTGTGRAIMAHFWAFLKKSFNTFYEKKLGLIFGCP